VHTADGEGPRAARTHNVRIEGWTARSPLAFGLTRGVLAAALATTFVVGAIIGGRISPTAFVAFGAALVLLAGISAALWPRTTILVVVLSPLVDRYVVPGVMPANLETTAHLLSEGLLLVVGLVVAARAWMDGRFMQALRHPVTLGLIAFALVAAVSALVNGVPPQVAALGLIFTLDAAALFFLPRLVGFTLRQALYAVGAIVAIVLGSALLAIAQAVLSPHILGLEPSRGRFGELHRLASHFGDPNVFGTFLVVAVPFVLLMATRLPTPSLRRISGAIAFVLILALWLSFSRGAWLAMILGVGTVLAIIDRRTVLLGLVISVVAFGTAVVMPRDLLVQRSPGEARPDITSSTIKRIETIGLGGDLRTLFVLNAIPIVRDHPLVGVGPGRYGGSVANAYETPIYEEYGTDRLFWNPLQRTVDNFWLHILVEMGIVGFLILLATAMTPGLQILATARRVHGLRRIFLGGVAAATAGMAISSATTMLLEANSIGFPFWFLLGLGGVVAAAATDGEDAQPN
jgi:O-antigen ligase